MSTESTISVSTPVMTVINVFTVEPARQQKLVALIVAAVEEVIQHQPGFISANIHASTDGDRIVNYLQWESEQAFEAMSTNPQVRECVNPIMQLTHAESRRYRVASVHHR